MTSGQERLRQASTGSTAWSRAAPRTWPTRRSRPPAGPSGIVYADSEVNAAVIELNRLSWAIDLVGLAALLVIALLVARTITRPINALDVAAQTLARGRPGRASAEGQGARRGRPPHDLVRADARRPQGAHRGAPRHHGRARAHRERVAHRRQHPDEPGAAHVPALPAAARPGALRPAGARARGGRRLLRLLPARRRPPLPGHRRRLRQGHAGGAHDGRGPLVPALLLAPRGGPRRRSSPASTTSSRPTTTPACS